MHRITATIALFCLASGYLAAQKSPVSPIEYLYRYKNDIAVIARSDEKILEVEDTIFRHFPRQLIRNKKGLFIALNGSGRLYQVILRNGALVFERQDSTIYFGDNFDSFLFSFRDTIYSLGGYGYWTTKGLLRYYVDQRHEWEIIRLNREIPVLTGQKHDLLWYDQQNGVIYFGITKEINSITKEPSGKFLHLVYALDLTKKEWKYIGFLTAYLKDNLTGLTNIVSSPFGQFAALKNQNIFLDYANNRIYRLSDTKQRELELLPTSTGDMRISYFADSTFYSWLSSKGLVDSFAIGRGDLILLPDKIYMAENEGYPQQIQPAGKKTYQWLTLLIAIVVAGLTGFYIGKFKSRNKKIADEPLPVNGQNPAITFTGLELDVIRCIAVNATKGNYTSIEEVNKALGVSKKNTEVQKKQRSDIITSINRKYSYIKTQPQELIEKRRTAFDKRSFEYFIETAKLTDALQLIKEPEVSGES